VALIVHQKALQMIQQIKPLIDRIARHDRALADQLRRSASSVPLNIGEAAYSRGAHQGARFDDAAGSASETRSALMAAAWGYVGAAVVEPVDAKLDEILAMLWVLTHRRKAG